jgi:hypothetical protein
VNPKNDLILTSKMLLLCELGEDGRRRARAEYDAYVRRVNEPVMRVMVTPALLLAGWTNQARAAFDELRHRKFPTWSGGAYTSICAHLAGQPVTEAVVIERARRDRELRCEASLFLGLGRLAEGDRAAAGKHFREGAGRYRCTALFATSWCIAFLSRLEKDPSWPPWIPVKKDDKGPNRK